MKKMMIFWGYPHDSGNLVNLRFYTGSCTAVKCPDHSSGTDLPTGCSCNAGYLDHTCGSGSFAGGRDWDVLHIFSLPSGKHTVQKNYGKSQSLMGKSTINGPFSIAMLNNIYIYIIMVG